MNLLDQLRSRRLLAIVRGRDADASLRAVVTLAEEQVGLVEVSLTGCDASRVIARARAELGPDAALGAGTVLTAQDARRAADAGASFLVTPGLGDGVLSEADHLGLPVLAGALTPTEIVAATRAAVAVKLFPASLGGPPYLRALREPFSTVPFVPVGGVEAASVRAYLARRRHRCRCGLTPTGRRAPRRMP